MQQQELDQGRFFGHFLYEVRHYDRIPGKRLSVVPDHMRAGHRVRGYVRGARLLSVTRDRNLIPIQEINHLIDVEFRGAAQTTAWYVGIYEGNYTPVSGDTMATFPAAATECTAYTEGTRRTLTLSAPSGGSADNVAAPAVFTMNATKTIYGGFISSVSAKGSTAGILGSAVKFSSPQPVTATSVLTVRAGFVGTSS